MTDYYTEGQLAEQRHQLLDPPEPPHAFRDEDETAETERLVQVQFRGVRGGWTTASSYDSRDIADQAETCPGFEGNPVAPDLCAGCGESRRWHLGATA